MLMYELSEVVGAAKALVAERPDDDSDEMRRLRATLESLDNVYPGPYEGIAAFELKEE